jgi:NTP pyrophosphatase (non-canonical NTP hydrolase)
MEHDTYKSDLTYYQEWTRKVWIDHGKDENITHALFGLQTETAELTDIHKKHRYTPKRAQVVDAYRDHIVEEIGDVLYYLARYADEQGITLTEVVDVNISKLEKRYGK